MSNNTPMSPHKLAQYFKDQDPETGITESAIRRLIKSGSIRFCKIGIKNLVTPAAVEEYFSGATATRHDSPSSVIRRLPERM